MRVRLLGQEIEIEFKNLLTESEFLQLKSYFAFTTTDFFKQVNHYIDTETFTLKETFQALRIREKDTSYELTLKQPAEIGLLETNQPITKEAYEQFIHHGAFPDGQVKTIIEQQHINIDDLSYFGSLTTLRAEKEYKGGLIVLDNSSYLNTEDFELEYEVSNKDIGQKHFNELLLHLSIPVRKTNNKVVRFYQRKKALKR